MRARDARRCIGPLVVVMLLLATIGACAPPPPEATTDETPAEEPTADSPPEAPSVSMTTGQGDVMTLTLRTLPDSRGYIYCELVFLYPEGSDIYSTSPVAPCSVEWWDGLDLEALAEEFGAEAVVKNGPQWWSMDEVGVMASEEIPVAGVNMVFGAHLPAGTMETPKYTVFYPAKYQNLTWKAGQPTYRLVDADGYVYVIQGHKVPADQLATLGDQMQDLPEGWGYVVEAPTEDLVFHLTPAEPIPSVQDEFDQIYIRIPE